MGDTYENEIEAEADRAQQKALLAALNAWDRALRRDECGAWSIRGTRGTIHTWGDGRTWALYATCRSAQHWTWTKKRLAFCKVTQDGDDEGVLRLQRLPTPHEAEAIRDIVGVRKRKEFDPVQLEHRRTLMARARSAQGRANRIVPLPLPTPEPKRRFYSHGVTRSARSRYGRAGTCQMTAGSDGQRVLMEEEHPARDRTRPRLRLRDRARSEL